MLEWAVVATELVDNLLGGESPEDRLPGTPLTYARAGFASWLGFATFRHSGQILAPATKALKRRNPGITATHQSKELILNTMD